MAHVIVVLNDGETYTNIDGCSIVVLSDEQMAMLEDTNDPRDIEQPVAIIELGTMFRGLDDISGDLDEDHGWGSNPGEE